MSSSTGLQPSKLGTKEHWDGVYEEELSNFREFGDEGEIWFGVESLNKMKEWVLKYVPIDAKLSILEIGSGNGTLLMSLIEAGYAPDLCTGVDYSPDAVRLAKSIAETRGLGDINFVRGDFIVEGAPSTVSGTSKSWDLVLDKGTFDAIALASKNEFGSSPSDVYPLNVANCMKPGGLFLITSCNFTEEELKILFASSKTGLSYHSRIEHPMFTFGGSSGSICSSVAFQKS